MRATKLITSFAATLLLTFGLMSLGFMSLGVMNLGVMNMGTPALAGSDTDKANQNKLLANLPGLPPAMGASEPAVIPAKNDDAMYYQTWFLNSFLDLKEDFATAKAEGKRFVVIFEQRGCIYCIKLHTKTLAKKYINDYVRENFAVVQLNMWGDREVVDFDGKTVTEKQLASRWGAIFTPTIVFLKDDLTGLEGKYGQPIEVARLNQVGAGTVYDMFVWIKHKIYEKERNFQRFHIERINQRRAMRGEKMGTDGKPLTPVKTPG